MGGRRGARRSGWQRFRRRSCGARSSASARSIRAPGVRFGAATSADDDRRVDEAPVAVLQARLSRLLWNGSSA
jgi:hypothetical protein